MVPAFEEKMRKGGSAAIQEASRFLRDDDSLLRDIENFAQFADKARIPYAFCGDMALFAHGCFRGMAKTQVLIATGDLEKIPDRFRKLGIQFLSFPDPATVSIEIDGIHYLQLPKLIELKLASGMTNPGRLKDLADVQELIRILKLELSYASGLNPYVQEKFKELWLGVQEDTTSE